MIIKQHYKKNLFLLFINFLELGVDVDRADWGPCLVWRHPHKSLTPTLHTETEAQENPFLKCHPCGSSQDSMALLFKAKGDCKATNGVRASSTGLPPHTHTFLQGDSGSKIHAQGKKRKGVRLVRAEARRAPGARKNKQAIS